MVHLGADAFAELRGEGAFSDGDDASFESAAAAAAAREGQRGGAGSLSPPLEGLIERRAAPAAAADHAQRRRASPRAHPRSLQQPPAAAAAAAAAATAAAAACRSSGSARCLRPRRTWGRSRRRGSCWAGPRAPSGPSPRSSRGTINFGRPGALLGSSVVFGSGCGQALPGVPRKAPLCSFDYYLTFAAWVERSVARRPAHAWAEPRTAPYLSAARQEPSPASDHLTSR